MAALVDTRMPGVYTVEVPTLPPSVALVPSAVPCFIGYTEKAQKNGEAITKPTRVRNMREYEEWFGDAEKIEMTVTIDDSTASGGTLSIKAAQPPLQYRMYYAMQLYYANGGGPCFVASVGAYNSAGNPYTEAFFKSLKKSKDITILVMPDAVGNGDYMSAVQQSLIHCSTSVNRISLIDVDDQHTDNEAITEKFRSIVPTQIDQKKYGAAYYPFLQTALQYRYATVIVDSFSRNGQALSVADATAAKAAVKKYTDAVKKLEEAKARVTLYTSIKNVVEKAHTANNAISIAELLVAAKKEAKRITGSESLDASLTGVADFAAFITAIDALIPTAADLTAKSDAVATELKAASLIAQSGDLTGMTLEILEVANNELASKIKQTLRDLPVILPPGPAIAGIMVQTDATQGVWQAPANVGVASVLAPTVEIDDDLHAALNVDAGSGKSINAIRTYEGRGVLVFGARTLAGNDLEWRYVSVRRTFCFIEDAIGRAMQSFVFAPNTRDTWIKVKAMISNFLVEIWKAGGLFGNTTNEAFQVNVGLPETMTDVDILEGRMIVEIKLRVSRPAEFIILKYEHKFQANAN